MPDARTCRPAPRTRSPSTRSGCCARSRFRVTVNTDNRLMSGTSMTQEMHLLSEAFGYGLADLQWLTVNAMKSSFLPFDERLRIINEVIKPGYASMALSDMMMG